MRIASPPPHPSRPDSQGLTTEIAVWSVAASLHWINAAAAWSRIDNANASSLVRHPSVTFSLAYHRVTCSCNQFVCFDNITQPCCCLSHGCSICFVPVHGACCCYGLCRLFRGSVRFGFGCVERSAWDGLVLATHNLNCRAGTQGNVFSTYNMTRVLVIFLSMI
jgi:hypothetical protein